MRNIALKELEDQKELIYRFFDENEKALMLILDACNWKVLHNHATLLSIFDFDS